MYDMIGEKERGWTFDPKNYPEFHTDRIVVATMDKGWMMALPGAIVDGEAYDDEAHGALMCPKGELFIEVDGVTYGYDAIVDFVRTVKGGTNA
jgi:hypothetical protein